MESVIFDVPEIFTCSWDVDVKAVIGRWYSFRTPRVRGIVTRHIAEGGARGALTCVIDLSGATGVPYPEDALWIDTHAPALLAEARIGMVITVLPAGGGPGVTEGIRAIATALGDGARAARCACLADALTISRDVLALAAT